MICHSVTQRISPQSQTDEARHLDAHIRLEESQHTFMVRLGAARLGSARNFSNLLFHLFTRPTYKSFIPNHFDRRIAEKACVNYCSQFKRQRWTKSDLSSRKNLTKCDSWNPMGIYIVTLWTGRCKEMNIKSWSNIWFNWKYFTKLNGIYVCMSVDEEKCTTNCIYCL